MNCGRRSQEGLCVGRLMEKANMANNKPVHQIRLSAIRAAIWLNVSEKTGDQWFATFLQQQKVETQKKLPKARRHF